MGAASGVSGHVLLVGSGEASGHLYAVLTTAGCCCDTANEPRGVLTRLHLERGIDVVLLAPEASLGPYSELCRQIKLDARTALLAVVFALGPEQDEHRADVYSAGADDCIQLPAPPSEVLQRLANACRVKRATDSLENATAVISSLANAIEGRDVYTRGHVERVSTYAVELGRRIGVSAADISTLRLGGTVHDIGKVAIPDQILNKAGPLTDDEFSLIQRHAAIGYDILRPCRTFHNALPLVRWHHERPNGTGYPDGIGGDELPLLPRIIGVADVFDALSTARSYRPAFSPTEYTAILLSAAKNEDLDPSLVELLLDMLDATSRAFAGTAASR